MNCSPSVTPTYLRAAGISLSGRKHRITHKRLNSESVSYGFGNAAVCGVGLSYAALQSSCDSTLLVSKRLSQISENLGRKDKLVKSFARFSSIQSTVCTSFSTRFLSTFTPIRTPVSKKFHSCPSSIPLSRETREHNKNENKSLSHSNSERQTLT